MYLILHCSLAYIIYYWYWILADSKNFCLFVCSGVKDLDVNHEVHSLPLPDNRNCIWRVPRARELNLCLYRSILEAGTGRQGCESSCGNRCPSVPWFQAASKLIICLHLKKLLSNSNQEIIKNGNRLFHFYVFQHCRVVHRNWANTLVISDIYHSKTLYRYILKLIQD